jgi:fumarylacetoacetate (FAA) hydrolase
MKLASLREGRDGALAVVSRDLARAVRVPELARTLQAALDDWASLEPALRDVYARLCAGQAPDAFPFDPARLGAPLPRAYQWADGSAYLHHVELARQARGAELPPSFASDPLLYQGGSDTLLGPRDEIRVADEAWGIDFEAEIAVVLDDVPMGVSPQAAASHIQLLVLVNDVSLRNLIPAELAKGFGFFQSKPSTAFSPVAVTPDELGAAWDGARLHGPLIVRWNGRCFGSPDAGRDMTFDFPALIAHAARTRALSAGTILGSGTVSNRDASRGSCCIAEQRARELAEIGEARTPFLRFGDRVEIEMLDAAGRSIFGAIDQRVVRYAGPDPGE